MKYLYYPGCSLRGSALSYHQSILAIAPSLSIELEEVSDWGCCGATVMKSIDEKRAEGLAAKALIQASQRGMDLLMPCPSCANNHLKSLKGWGTEDKGREGYAPAKTPQVKHVMEVLGFDLGPEAVQRMVKRPMVGLRVLPYYGCLVLRPFGLGGKESMENPRAMERLVQATGAKSLFFPERVDCCGGGLLLTHEEIALRLSSTLIRRAKRLSPDCILVACPLCHFMLDAKQKIIEKEVGEEIGIPVLFITQWLGLAFGIDSKALAIDRLITPLGDSIRKVIQGN